jgi:hypothetical protein
MSRLALLLALFAGAAQTDQTFNQAQAVAGLRASIAGKETLPAEQVFKNIQTLKGVPARNVIAIMEVGYSQSLGVTCTHCHVVNQWDSDDKPAKAVTRDMWKMMQTINTDLLQNIKGLKGPNPIVNCTTCHRGQVKPALNMPASGK